MKQNIMFDLDDTLIYCNKYFNLILDQFTDEMLKWFSPADITREMIMEKQTEIDIAGVHILGFKSEHFPQSFVAAYHHFCALTGRKASSDEEESLHKLGLSVYDQEIEAYPQMEETLEILAERGHLLHLYTGGDSVIQRRKIHKAGLDRFFHNRIYVRQHKNTDALRSILTEGSFDLGHTWMIGNSIRTDVLPALENGIHAIYMKREDEWAYNMLPLESTRPKGALLTLTELRAIPSAIRGYLEQQNTMLS